MDRKHAAIFVFCLVGWGFSLAAAVAPRDGAAGENTSVPSPTQIELNFAAAQVRRGEFKSCLERLSRSVSAQPRLKDIQSLLEAYLSLQQQRDTQEEEACGELEEKLSRSRAAWQEGKAEEAEGLLRLLSQIKRYRPLRADSLLSEPWAQTLLSQTEDKCQSLESQGQYIKAYYQAIQWLSQLDPNDREYSERGKRLLEQAAVEQALTPPACAGLESGYAPAEKGVLFAAMELLERHYLRPPDFSAMASAVCRRGDRLADALHTGRRDFLYQVDPNQIELWREAVAAAAQSVQQREIFSRRDCELLIEELLSANEDTLGIERTFLVYLFSDAALHALDPYTEIVWPADSGDFDKRMTGQFAGVGIRLGMDEGKLKVVEILPQTPAEENGRLQPEDRITAIGAESTEQMNIECAVAKISGPEGTAVTLAIHRPDSGEDFTVELVRRRIVIPTLQGAGREADARRPDSLMCCRIDADPGIGYIRIDRFGPSTAVSLRSLLETLQRDGLKGLLIDLRSNTGGLLDASAAAADLFLKEGLIVKTQPRSGTSMRFEADAHQLLVTCPLVLLIDEATASGAEIMAAALACPGQPRAVLVGMRSYGKGTVQEVEPLVANGTRIKFTRSLYVLSNDRRVPNRCEVEAQGGTGWGIAPDVEVPITPGDAERIRKIHRQLKETDPDDPSLGKVLRELVRTDPQLAAALTILKIQLIAAGYDLRMFSEPADVLLAEESNALKTSP